MFALDILNQLQNENGSLLSDGRIYVYYLGRTRLADIYNDIDGQIPLPNPVILDNLGMSEIYLSNAYDYTVVVTDPYGTELFSRDIFTSPLQEGGANARLYEGWDPIVVNNNVNVISAKMANLGVEAPLYFAEDSESATIIGISGELGKTYSGIDPIVVNNELNKISANTKTLSAETPLYITDYDDKTVISVQSAVLGVESPLYFVENSETATVIGIQGSAVNPSGAMYESAFGYEDGKITGYNGSGFSAGSNYEAGNYIDINGNTISVTGLQPSGNYAYNSALSSKLDTSSFSSVSGDFLTAIPDEYATKEYVISSVSSKLDVSSFSSISGDWLTKESADTLYQPTGNYQTAGDYYSASNPSAFVTSGELSVISGEITGMIPTGEYLTKESADTLYQPIGDYLTTADSGNFYTTANESGFVTNSEVINNYVNLSSISGSDGQITSINGSALPGGITYTGIEPIVVNNNEAKISANTIGITGISPIEIIESNNSLVVSANLSGYATTGQLASVSGDITAMIPTALTGEYLTKESADTLYQPIGNYQAAGNYVSASELTAYATTSLVSSVSSTITGMIPTGDFELVAGAGIELVDDPSEHTTTINVTAQGGNPEVEQVVINNSATWDTVTAKADTTAIPSTAGLATEDWVTAQGYITGVDLSNYATTGDLQTVSGEITAMIPTALTGEYVAGNNETGFAITGNSGSIIVGPNEYLESQAIGIVKSNSGIWLSPNRLEIYGNGLDEIVNASDISALKTLSASKLDVTAFSDVSGTFLTAHQDLSDYQTTAGMTAYQEKGDYLSANALDNLSGTWETVTAKLDTTAFSDVSSTFLTAHQDLSDYQTTAGMTAYQPVGDYATNTELQTVSGEITALIPTGEYLDKASADTLYYPLESNPAGYLTAHQSLDGYATITDVESGLSGKEDTLTFTYTGNAINTINGSAIVGESIPFDVYGISASANIELVEEDNTLWISGRDWSEDLTAKQDITGMTGYVTLDNYNSATAKISELENIISSYSARWLLV